MHDGRFDPSGFYEFNLTGGTVRTRTGERVVILSEDVLSSLVAAAARDRTKTTASAAMHSNSAMPIQRRRDTRIHKTCPISFLPSRRPQRRAVRTSGRHQ